MTQRTTEQNAALHLYCEQIADALNDAGYDQRLVMEKVERLEIPNTKESVKAIFRAVAHQLYDVESTAELTTTQTSEVAEAVSRGFAQKFGVAVPWPSEETLYDNHRKSA